MHGPVYDDEPLDLSALDPRRDPERWRAVVEGTRTRVDAVLETRAGGDDPLDVLASWRRPLLVAAAAAILALIPAEIALERREAEMERVQRLVAISHWASPAQRPTGADFLRALGGWTP